MPRRIYDLATALAGVGRTAEAIDHYQRALQLRPDFVMALNDQAWLLATREPAEGGDPAQAVRLAEQARELGGADSAPCLDTLAVAYAADGQFSDAMLIADRALELAESAGQTTLAQRIQQRLTLYRAGQALP